jgi:phosphoglycolate phosphatase
MLRPSPSCARGSPARAAPRAEAKRSLARRVIRAVLIDLDGTLLDTAPDLAAAANAMLADLHLAQLPAGAVREFIGQGIDALVRRCLDAAGAQAGVEALARERFALHYAALNGRAARAFPGVAEGLERMRAARLRLACVTNKPARFTLPLLERAGLAGIFDAVVTSDAVGRRKPDPALFLEACRRLGVAAQEAAAVGDSENDALGARAAGCRVYLVPYGYRQGRDVRSLPSDGIVATLLEAAEACIEAV